MTIGGGVESLSRVPMGSDGGAMVADPSFFLHHYFFLKGNRPYKIATKYGNNSVLLNY